MSAISASLSGLHQAENLLNQTASRIARAPRQLAAPQDEVSLSDSAVAMLQARDSYQANLATIRVAESLDESALNLTDPNARARTPG